MLLLLLVQLLQLDAGQLVMVVQQKLVRPVMMAAVFGRLERERGRCGCGCGGRVLQTVRRRRRRRNGISGRLLGYGRETAKDIVVVVVRRIDGGDHVRRRWRRHIGSDKALYVERSFGRRFAAASRGDRVHGGGDAVAALTVVVVMSVTAAVLYHG